MNAHARSPSPSPLPAAAPVEATVLASGTAPVATYWVFSADQQHVGPVSADLIGRGVLAGKVPPDAFVSAGANGPWVAIDTVAEINAAIEAAKSAPPSPPPGVTSSRRSAQPTFVMAPRPPVASIVPEEVLPRTSSAAMSAGTTVRRPQPEPAAPPPKPDGALDPRLKLLPLVLFGGCAFVGAIETALALILR